jgi:hypothetical protein
MNKEFVALVQYEAMARKHSEESIFQQPPRSSFVKLVQFLAIATTAENDIN